MSIIAVIVSYHPDSARISRLVISLQRNRCGVIIVDNTEGSGASGLLEVADNCQVISLGDNFGLGYAQNVGISTALANGAEIVLYFDQDSEIEDGFVATLVATLTPDVPAVVAPTYWNAADGAELPSQRLNWLGVLSAQYSQGRTLPYPADVVIASGMATTAVTFERVGLMDESLFIDWVDTEWSLRCRRRGVPIHIVPAARMRHSIGGHTVRCGIIQLAVHSPARCYYQIRNGLLLLRRKHISSWLIFVEWSKLLLNRAFLLAVVRPRGAYFMKYILAIAHGLAGVIGKLPAR